MAKTCRECGILGLRIHLSFKAFMIAYLQFGVAPEPCQTISAKVKTTDAPVNRYLTGYGKKIPTRHMALYEGRWRRIYCSVFSNVGKLFVMVDNKQINVQVNDDEDA